MKKIIFIMICIQLISSCTESTKNMVGQKVVIVPEVPTGKGETFLKNFELDTIVPLETTDEYLVTYIKRAIRYKDKLILLNSNPAYIFVVNIETGKVEAFINRQGNGPGESHYIYDIAVDEQNGEILVYNDYFNLLFFNMNGQFLRGEKLEYCGHNMTYYDGKVLFNEKGEGTACYPYEFHIYDIEKKMLQKIGDSKRVDFNVKIRNHLVKSKNIWFVVSLDYNLYKYNNGNFEIPYTLIVQHPITERLVQKNKEDVNAFDREINENKIIYGFGTPIETDRFILFISNRFGFMMINKQTSELSWEQYINEEQLGLPRLYDLFPIDGDENRVMFIVSPDEWLREVAAHPEKISPKWQEQISKMNIVEDSNPILLFYREKKEAER